MTTNLQTIDDQQIQTLKGSGKALALLNKTLEASSKDSKVKVFTVCLNKQLAEFLLKFNLKDPKVTNRPINWSVVESMARQMLNGHFRNTGEPLLFTDTADGIDLQHRCNAVLKAAEINPEVSYETTVLTGIHVDNIEALIDNLLVMGVAKRTKTNLAHFANVDTHKWEMVEYYMLPENIKPGSINKAMSRLEINDEYKTKREYFDSVYETIATLFRSHGSVNDELGTKRIPIYAAAALKMFDIDREKGMLFMEAFFNPLENSLPKGNPVDALRSELVETFATGQRDKTRPIFIRRAMLLAFDALRADVIKTKWKPFIGATVKQTVSKKDLASTATAIGEAAMNGHQVVSVAAPEETASAQ
jgi:hypothetical protein